MLLSAALFGRAASGALFGVAAASLLLLCVGIHNSWDSVTYMTVNAVRLAHSGARPPSAPSAERKEP